MSHIKQFRRRLIALLLGICIIVGARMIYLSGQAPLFEYHGATMGTTYVVKLAHAGISRGQFRVWTKECQSLLRNINHSMSHYDSKSELSHINRSRDIHGAIELSAPLAIVLRRAKEIYFETAGFFDVTVAPLVNLWGFGPEDTVAIPSDADVQKKLAFIGSDKYFVTGELRFKKTIPELMIDLSAIAKGYAVDVLAGFFQEQGCRNFMIEIGGEVRCEGENPEGQVWKIGIENPTKPKDTFSIVVLHNKAMATSGDYRKFVLHEGVKYSHTINPKTGFPVKHSVASVTVIAPTCIDADAYATALHVMGLENGLAWLENHPDIEAYFVLRGADQTLSTRMTQGFRKYLIAGSS